MTMYTTKILLSISNTAITNSFGSTIWTYLVIDRALFIMNSFHISIFLLNNISTLLSFKKSILKIISNLILTTKKVF